MQKQKTIKRAASVFLILVLLLCSITAAPKKAEAAVSGISIDIKSPKDGAKFYVGDKIAINVSPSLVIYGISNYAQVQIYKGSKRVDYKNISYSSLGTYTTYFTPTSTGSYTIKAGYSTSSSSTMLDEAPNTVNIEVVDPKADVAAIRPVVKVHRFSQTVASLYFDMYDGYYVRIYRSTEKTSGFKLIKTVKNTNYFEDTGLTKNTKYYYKIRLLKKIGTDKYYSRFSYVRAASAAGLPDIRSVRYVPGVGVKLVWKESPYADYYWVIREPGTFRKVAKGKTAMYDKSVQPGKTYKYEIKAYNETEGNGKASEWVKITIPAG